MAIDWGYVAGYFDGEGSIRVKHYSIELVFANTNSDSLREIQRHIGGGYIRSRTRSKTKPHWKQLHTLEISDHYLAERVLENIKPFCIIKAAPVAKALDFIHSKQWRNHKRITPQELETIRSAYWDDRKTLTQVASAFGFKHESYVRNLLKKHGIPTRTISQSRSNRKELGL